MLVKEAGWGGVEGIWGHLWREADTSGGIAWNSTKPTF